MANGYASIIGRITPAVISGKRVALGRSLGRDDATAGRLLYCARARERTSAGGRIRAAIQGIGNASVHIARLLRYLKPLGPSSRLDLRMAVVHIIGMVPKTHNVIAKPMALRGVVGAQTIQEGPYRRPG